MRQYRGTVIINLYRIYKDYQGLNMVSGLRSTLLNRGTSGLLFFLAGAIILMGIITAEIFYPAGYSTANSEISDLGATRPPHSVSYQPSASIFNLTMIVGGLLIIFASSILFYEKNGFFITIRKAPYPLRGKHPF
jgi:hypothetical protein